MRSFRSLVRLFAITVSAAAAGLTLSAQRRGGVPAPPPPVPVTAGSLAAHPADYVGRTVAMMGTVAQQLSPTVFTVDQGPATTLPLAILVVAPTLTAAAPPRAYVTVIGDAALFDPANLRAPERYSLDISPDAAAKYRGRPVVIAASVLTPDLTDLAKPKPQPLSPEEEAFSNLMKQVSPAATALRTSVAASDGGTTRGRAAELGKLFGDVQAFFKKRGLAEPEGWAGEVRKLSVTIDAAAAASNWPEAASASSSLTQLCTTCHAAYRERLEDGTYRLKGAR